MSDCEGPPQRPRRFLAAFSLTLAMLLGAVAFLNWQVDPFAQYGTGRFAPVVRTSRGEKLELLAAQTAPQGLVLGSSRVMKLEPTYLEAKTGRTFFNAGVYYGRSEDFLAILRAYHSAYDAWPEMLVVGVDVDAFVEHPGPDARLIRHDVLRGQIPELLSWDDASRPYRELISWQQTTASLRSLRHGEAMRREAAEEESFAHDGKIVYNRREAELSRGAYDLHSACEYTRKEYRRLFQGYRRLDPMRVAAWNSLTTVCREHDVELVAFLTPYRTETLESVQSTGQFAPRRTEVLELLEATLPSSGRLADLTEIESFDGDPALFVDGVHPLEANTRRMIDVLLSHAPLLVSKARYAL